MWIFRGAVVASACGCLAAGVLVAALGGGFPEWVFGSVLLTTAVAALLSGVTAARQAWSAAGHASALGRLDPASVAAAAVQEERRRLSQDIASQLRQVMAGVLEDIAGVRSEGDPTRGLRSVRRRTEQATSELRRHLGLLRAEAELPSEIPGTVRSVWRPRELGVAAAVSLVALVEALAYPRVEDVQRGAVSVVLTVLAAGTVAGCRSAPGAAAVTCGSIFLLGAATGRPVVSGFWTLAAVCAVVWYIVARRPLRDLAAGAFLVVAAGVATVRDDPGNAGVMVLLMAGSAAGGAAVRLLRRRSARSEAAARERSRAIEEAARAAVRGERGVFAREVHDVVSHAVGVIAVQAGAAEVSWPARPEVTRSALDAVESTARAALDELRQLPAPDRSPRSLSDIQALVGRIRAGGTRVQLQLRGPVPELLDDAVYRIVQETLTNVVRHAPGATAVVRIVADDRTLTITTRDDGPGAGAGAARGYGLVGLGERTGFAGGRMTAGDAGDGSGFLVTATLPLRPESAR